MNSCFIVDIQASFCSLTTMALFGFLVSAERTYAGYPVVDEETCLRFSMLVDEQSIPIKVYRDSSISNRFYYLVDKPRLQWEKESEAKLMPRFQMLKYQVPADLSKQVGLKEGALLRFTLRMDLPQGVVTQLKNKIAAEIPELEKPIQLDRLPMRNMLVALFSTGSTEIVRRQDSLISTRDINDSVHFSTHLIRTEAAIVESLLGSSSGLPVSYVFDVDGVQKQAGFTLWIDWGTLLERLGEVPTELRRKHWNVDSWLPLKKQQQGIRSIIQTLVQFRCVKVTREGKEVTDLNSIFRWELAGPVLQQIRDELFGPSRKFPRPTAPSLSDSDPQVELQSNSESLDAETFEAGGDELQLDAERVELLKKTKSRFDLESQQVRKSTLAVAGFLSLRDFLESNPDGQGRIISWLRRDKWNSAYFYLPQLATSDSGVQEVDITISITDQFKKKVLSAKTARWAASESAEGTWEIDGQERNEIWFDLLPLEREFGRDFKKSVAFKIETNIRTDWGDDVTGVDYIPVFSGEVPIASPLSSFSQIDVDGSQLLVDTMTRENWRVELSVSGQRQVKTLNQESIAAKFLIHDSWLQSKALSVDYYLDGTTATSSQTLDLRNHFVRLNWPTEQTGLK